MSSITVLLTGGPGGGKSSAMATLRDHLSKRGYQVLVVPETATCLLGNSGGYDPDWHATTKHIDLQKIMMKFQMQQEDTFRNIAHLRPDKPYVILHDRGLLDGRLFCNDLEWSTSLKDLNTTEDELLNRYDLVLHMTSIAQGMEHLYEFGPGSNNPARYHTPEMARESDVSAKEIYARHPQVRTVQNFPDFAEKIRSVEKFVLEALHADNWVEGRQRELIPKLDENGGSSLWPVECKTYEFQVTYLDAKLTESVRLRQLVKKCKPQEGTREISVQEDKEVLYEYRKEVQQGERTICTRKVLSAEAYHLLKQRKADSSVVTEVGKRSVLFIWEGMHYEILSYFKTDGKQLPDNWQLHDYDVLDKQKGAPVPPWLLSTEAEVSVGKAITESKVPEIAPSPGADSQGRKLSRCTTADAAYSVEKAIRESDPKRARKGSPTRMPPLSPARRKPPSRSASELLHSPSLSKAAANIMRPACEDDSTKLAGA